ncbi:transcription factor E2FB isoform X1 [Cucumis melo var. makuwa]|uniref:Transcription factor E2FB isoform X1 n=1 Tax=Cucumis melo var. makuwa TaxID=1194695 RepID=A0A5D3BC72_CUCMM|nr:transcription factor E2FB isoform X1 [Cucumis melo var. makuwa]
MSGSRPPNSSGHLPDQIMHSLKRQLPFSSVKPPFASPGDYHRFAPDSRLADQESDAIVVKSPFEINNCLLTTLLADLMNLSSWELGISETS